MIGNKEALRDVGTLASLGSLSLDMKLGLRMLKKYLGLTIVGGLAMAFAIWVGAVVFQVMGLFVHPSLPLRDGDRIVRVANWDVEASDTDPRALNEFIAWRENLSSVTDLGAYRDVTRNLITSDGNARRVVGAEVTATAFRIVADSLLWIVRMWLRVSALLAAIAVLLSLSGIYAVLSFTVSRRTREIGVRVALGASPRRVVGAIFRRPLTHVTLGVLTGGALIALMAFAVAGGDGGLARVEGV